MNSYDHPRSDDRGYAGYDPYGSYDDAYGGYQDSYAQERTERYPADPYAGSGADPYGADSYGTDSYVDPAP